MSIYIRAERPGSESRLFRIRRPIAEIGEDEFGLLSTSPNQNTLFSLERRGENALVLPHRELIAQGHRHYEPFWVTGMVSFHTAGYDFTLLLCTNKAETGALTDLSPEQLFVHKLEHQPHISYRLAALTMQIPLPIGMPVTIGADETDTLFIPLPGVSPCHCVVTAKADTVQVHPLNGSVEYCCRQLHSPIDLEIPNIILLRPSGLPISLK